MAGCTLHLGDCLEVMRTMPDCSVDAVVTDPPYGLSFMGKAWDYDVPGVDVWREALRVLKPGGHLLAFAGTRTQHRMAVNIEDAGFEIRDMIAWVYGCLDDQTQYASPDGPRPYHRAMVGDPVLCYNAETKEYSYQPIQDVYVYDYADTAYRLVGDYGVQVVSRNHRCLVERSGAEVFITAEEAAREQQARVPVLEDLPELQQALSRLHEGAGHTEQDLQQRLCCSTDRSRQLKPQADRAAQADEGAVCGVRRRNAQAELMAEAHHGPDVQPAMQRGVAGPGVEEVRQQGALTVEAGIGAGADRADDRTEQPGMERRAHLSQPQGRLCQPADQACPLSGSVDGDGTEGRLRDGASAAGCSGDRQAAHQGRSCASCQPRRNGQPAGESDAVRHQRSAQGVRAWSGHRTTVVRIEPFRYIGKVWCLKVPTGCFVAVRDGMAFPTGNSGFPKSLDVSKAIDKAAGAEREVVGVAGKSGSIRNSMAGDFVGGEYMSTAPATPEAQQWDGWGTALKPALEPITVARKPLGERTVAANVLEHGTGALNVDGCRVGSEDMSSQWDRTWNDNTGEMGSRYPQSGRVPGKKVPPGRWPANLIHDGSDDVVGLFPQTAPSSDRPRKNSAAAHNNTASMGKSAGDWITHGHNDNGGSAARFFYTAKASKDDRDKGNTHPTVKPTDLMAYLCRLVTPPGGIVLDPFMGSGTTGKAALSEGFQFIGIEREPAYFAMAEHRMNGAQLGLGLDA
jgi:DNA modification methylase